MRTIKGHTTLNSGLVGYWTLDGDANDKTGSGHNGTPSGSPTFDPGKIEDGVTLNGTNQRVEVAHHSEFESGRVSVSVWAKLDTVSGSGLMSAVVKRSEWGGGADKDMIQWSLQYDLDNEKWIFQVGNSVAAYTAEYVGAAGTDWHLLVGTFDGDAVRLFVDGAVVDVNTDPTSDIVSKAFPVEFGAQPVNEVAPFTYDHFFDGMLDEIGIWDRDLTTPEIQDLYNHGVGLWYDEEPIDFQGSMLNDIIGTEVPLPPRVTAAVATAYNKVRVEFDQEMFHTNPAGPYDATNPSNYLFASGTGIPRSGTSVSLLGAAPTIVEVTLSGEMTNGVAYSAVVSNVRSLLNEPLDPQYCSQGFSGLGILPRVTGAVALSSGAVQVDFDEPMLDNAAFVDKNNYVIGGYGTVSVNSVTKNSSTRVTLNTELTMKTGETYIVTVSNVQDEALNYLDPAHKSASFNGVGEHPKLVSTATPIDSTTVQIEFTKDVVGAEATDPENYQIQREGGIFLELQKWWEVTGSQGLKCKAAVEEDYDPASAAVTVVAVLDLDANDSRVLFDKLDGTSNGYRLETTSSGELKATYGNGALSSVQTSGETVPTGERVLVALRYDGVNLTAAFVGSSGLKKNSAAVPGAGNSTELFFAFLKSDLSQGVEGKLYWTGYFESALSDADLQNLHAETDHPRDHSPKIYVDMHKDVGATYKPEVAPSAHTDWYLEVIGTPVKVGITQITGDTFQIKTAEQNTGKTYTITVLAAGTPYPSGIHDFIGNDCKAPDNTATFLGIGVSPPYIDIEPPDDERDVAVRNQLRVHVWDDPEEFSGIDETVTYIEVLYTDDDDVVRTIRLVDGGAIQPHAIGTKTGNPLDADGLHYRLLPRAGRWEVNKTYTVRAYTADIEGSPNFTQQTFRTTILACFEDILPEQDALDTKLLTPFSGTNIEKLRQIMLAACTTSKTAQVQARSLLHVAAITDLRAALAEVVDFGLVDSVKLCERQPILNIRRKLLPYWSLVKPALDEIPKLGLDARRMLERYTASQSVVYAVNAVAAAIVLAAAYEDS
jgi:hypothetical protein